MISVELRFAYKHAHYPIKQSHFPSFTCTPLLLRSPSAGLDSNPIRAEIPTTPADHYRSTGSRGESGARWWRWLIVAVAVETQAAVPWVPQHHWAGPPDGFRCESAEPQVESDPADERASVSGRLCERLKVSLLSIKGFLFCIISANETCTWVN